MTIHDFLKPKDKERLMAVLRETSLFSGLDSSTRQNWLKAAGINIAVDTNGDEGKFFTNLYGLLVDLELPSRGEKRLGIIVLLDHIVLFDPIVTKKISSEDIEFLKEVIKKYEVCRVSPPPTSNQVKGLAALEIARSKRSSAPAPRGTYRFDTDLILNSDLKKQVSEFNAILQIEGIFPFTLDAPFEVLQNYFVKRLEHTIRNNDDRQIKRVDVNLYAKNSSRTSTGYQIIEQQIKDSYYCERLTDLFDEQQRIDVLLVVWNYDFPYPEVSQIAESFWSEVQPQLVSIVSGYSRRFIVLWINIVGEPLNLPTFHALPALKCFDVGEIVPYFRDRLLKYHVEAGDLEYFLKQLKHHEGGLLGTYLEMNRLVESFTGGRVA